jgi:methanol metabolism-related c-type cytochrome
MMKKCLRASAFKMPAAVVLAMAVFSTSVLLAAGPSVREEEGKHFNKDDEPTYNVQEDGTVDWYTYSGFRRYHSECHVCHGPDGMGSTYAPAITDSLKTMSYADFLDVVVNGRQIARADKTSAMPALGENQNVMCFIDDLFVYLKARADGAVPRGRPQKRADKPEDAIQYEKSCFGRD